MMEYCEDDISSKDEVQNNGVWQSTQIRWVKFVGIGIVIAAALADLVILLAHYCSTAHLGVLTPLLLLVNAFPLTVLGVFIAVGVGSSLMCLLLTNNKIHQAINRPRGGL